MKAKAAMIIAHTMHRQSGKTSIFADCLKKAWAIVKSGRTIPVLDMVNKEGRRVKTWVKTFSITDEYFATLAKKIESTGCKVFGYENLLAKKPVSKPSYMSVPCPYCGTYCWGDCQA